MIEIKGGQCHILIPVLTVPFSCLSGVKQEKKEKCSRYWGQPSSKGAGEGLAIPGAAGVWSF